ncbi:MAG: hypothetical protein J6B24_08820 [Clostridia bacterium]|nr:hypothetical protein [Clostridia bacterium]
MSKCTKGLLIAALCVLTTWLGLACLYTYSVSEELTMLRRENRSDTVYLRYRIRELESELDAGVKGLLPSEPVGGGAADIVTPPAETGKVPESEAMTDADQTTVSPDTEAVTLPVHQSPETQAPAEPETAVPPSLYLIAEHNGIIGLFDASGELLQSVNVFVMTLPEAEREALAVGIPAWSWSEAVEMLDRYE